MILSNHRPKLRLHRSALPSMSSRSYDPLFLLFRSISPTMPYCSVFGLQAFLPSWFWARCRGYQPPNRSSPSWSLLCPHSAILSAVPSLFPTSVLFRNSSSDPTACLFASSSANQIWPLLCLMHGRPCHIAINSFAVVPAHVYPLR